MNAVLLEIINGCFGQYIVNSPSPSPSLPFSQSAAKPVFYRLFIEFFKILFKLLYSAKVGLYFIFLYIMLITNWSAKIKYLYKLVFPFLC